MSEQLFLWIIREIRNKYRKRKYHKFLKSEAWRALRRCLIKRNQLYYRTGDYKFKCVWCNDIKPLKQANVHHTSYRYGLLNEDYLKVICSDCHKSWHSKYKVW
ncbi:MAG: hypothetical protein ACFFG0_12220 [Candidatus Thorarchaeota archaeon]